MSHRPYRTTQTQGPRVRGDMLFCRECSTAKPLDAFRILKSGSRETYCRECHNAITRAWRERTKEERNAARRQTHDPKPCEACGCDFTPTRGFAKYCSPACQRSTRWRNESHRRVVAYRAVAKVRPLVIATYGMRCHLCGGRIDERLDRNHSLALTIDHVVPISRGGSDEIENLRPAHRACNVRKSDRDGLTEAQQFEGYLRAELAIMVGERAA
jgi:5-methylcytosine-specific restriction endonuclease McrA